MITFIIAIVLLIAGAALRLARRKATTEDGEFGLSLGSGVALVLGSLFMFVPMVTFVPDGSVGVTRAFGEYGRELGAGPHLLLPWETTVELDGKVKSWEFANGEDAVDGPISAQASGGGNLVIDLTVQTRISPDNAASLLRNVGTDWFNVIVRQSTRSCVRNSASALTVDDAYGEGRALLDSAAEECIRAGIEPHGITLIDVLIREVDPGQAVRASIDLKQQSEQEVLRASINVQLAEAEARAEAIRAFGVSNAEQIVACGGTESVDDSGNSIIIPNAECEDQFSDEYLQWLYINQLSEVDGTVILPPEFDGTLFINP